MPGSSNGISHFSHASTRLRHLLEAPGCIQAPGVYDGISARLAIEAGFKVLYQSGAMTTASRLGLPDLAFASVNDFANNGQMIANLDPSIPLIADADTGFGGPNAIARTVRLYHQCGIAGLHLEDQIQMKRCGHLNGKQLVDRDTWRTRIRAAVLARNDIASDMVIIARTDALESYSYDECMQRLLIAKAEGADVAFLEAVKTMDQIKDAVKTLAPMKVLVNLVPNGKTPSFSVEELSEAGVKLAIYPVAAANPVVAAIRQSFSRLRDTGRDDSLGETITPRQFFDIMGLEQEIELDRAAGGTAWSNDA